MAEFVKLWKGRWVQNRESTNLSKCTFAYASQQREMEEIDFAIKVDGLDRGVRKIYLDQKMDSYLWPAAYSTHFKPLMGSSW